MYVVVCVSVFKVFFYLRITFGTRQMVLNGILIISLFIIEFFYIQGVRAFRGLLVVLKEMSLCELRVVV